LAYVSPKLELVFAVPPVEGFAVFPVAVFTPLGVFVALFSSTETGTVLVTRVIAHPMSAMTTTAPTTHATVLDVFISPDCMLNFIKSG
jgi:hypothetical protein